MEKKQIQFVSVTPEELKCDLAKLIKKEVALALKEFNNNNSAPDKTFMLTRENTAKMLSINLSSLWKYTKDGMLTSYKIPNTNRVYYKKNEVIAAIKKIKLD